MLHDDSTSKRQDLIVIGAGIYGIQAARTYLELYPEKHVTVLDAAESIGGVWSRERVYNDFWTQTPLGILEFSDQSIHTVPKQDQHFGFFKASHVTDYLEAYCSNHVYEGKPLSSRIRLGTSVTIVRKVDGIWNVDVVDGQQRSIQYQALKIVDASGLTSHPNWPKLQGYEQFSGTLVHHKDFAKWESAQDEDVKLRVVVIGGAKSAADVAYSCAKVGHSVTWLIRRSGSGPAAFVSAKGSFGYQNSNESFYTRFTSLFLASLFSFGHGYDNLLRWIHGTAVGRKMLQRIWSGINKKAWQSADYDRPDGRENGFQNLKPDTELFWQNDSTGVNQRDDFFDLIARQVRVIRQDISHMNANSVVMEDGTAIDADVVICATGWKMAYPFFDQETAAGLGLPVDCQSADSVAESHWAEMLDRAKKDVFARLPILDSDWARRNTRKTNTEMTPFRLWKSMVPIHDSSIVFVGKLMLGNHFRNAEVQALFACAVLSGLVTLPSVEESELDIAQAIAWCRARYPGGKGALGNWYYWDMVPYTDALLVEMGLRSHRHKGAWKDLFRPCGAADLKHLVTELRLRLKDR